MATERRHVHEMPTQTSLLFRGLSAVLVSVIIPLLTGVLFRDRKGDPVLNGFQQVEVGIFIFVVAGITSAVWDVNQLLRVERGRELEWQLREPVDTTLLSIRDCYLRILSQRTLTENLYAQYFARLLSSIDDQVYEASTKQELVVDELTFSTTDLVMKIMNQRAGQVLRLVHPLDMGPTEFDFRVWSVPYYRDLTSMAALGRIEIRRLFIYAKDDDLAHPTTVRLLDFHWRNQGHAFRIIRRSDWNDLLRGRKLPLTETDFGVWGDLFAYWFNRAGPAHIEGTYTTRPRRVEHFREVFDAAWGLSPMPEPRPGDPMTVYQLFEGVPPPEHLLQDELRILGVTGKRRGKPQRPGGDKPAGDAQGAGSSGETVVDAAGD